MKKVLFGIILGITYIIPGLCSTSMAISLGVYEDLLEVLSSFYKIKTLKKHFFFLLGMLMGLIISFLILMRLYEKFKVIFTSIFIGFIIGSIEKRSGVKKHKPSVLILSLVIIFSLLLLDYVGKNQLAYVNDNNTLFSLIITFILSFISSVAFILPGISGSMLMFVFGLYDKILKSVQLIFEHQNLTQLLREKNFMVLFIIIGGFLIGILTFSKIIDKIIKNKSNTFFLITNAFVYGSMLILIFDLCNEINYFYEIILVLLFIFLGLLIRKNFIKKSDE